MSGVRDIGWQQAVAIFVAAVGTLANSNGFQKTG
jgi:hypothetical protein